ncbi:hypothetical protein QTP88_003783 [Uroleucon formosanum]
MAVPFMLEPDPDDTPIAHYLRIQNLLRELMTLLRQMPSRMIGDSLGPPRITNLNIISSIPLPHSEEARVQQQQNSARALHRRRQRENQQQRGEQQQQRGQQPQLLPDLVTSCEQSASRPPPPPPAPPASPPQQQQMQAQQQSAADGEDDKVAGAVKLQVAVCPACYYGKERKLKVIAIAKLDENGKPIRWTCNNRDDEEPVVVENKSSKVKRRILSLFQPSKIESSVLTAVFVIIGWKMFIKQ